MKFAIIIPTYKRARKLEKCLQSIAVAILEPSIKEDDIVKIYPVADDCAFDFGLTEYFSDRITSSSFFPSIKITLCQNNTRRKAFGTWNDFFSALAWDFDGFVYLCDDIELDPDCLSNLFAVFKEKFPDTDGLIGICQKNIPRDKEGYSASAMGLIGRRFARRYPDMKCFCPDYSSFHADAELQLYARKLNKFHYAENARLTHYHPAYFSEMKDDAHEYVRIPEVVKKDRETWNIRRKKGLLWGESFELINK